MAAASFGSSKLDHLRSEARSKGLAWLRSEMDKTKRDELRQLAQAAGLRVRREDNVSLMSAGELRKRLVELVSFPILYKQNKPCRTAELSETCFELPFPGTCQIVVFRVFSIESK